jgi:hypothetical protein
MELRGESIASQEQEKKKRSSASLLGTVPVPISSFLLHGVVGRVYFQFSSQEQEKIVSFLSKFSTLPISSFSLHGVAGRVYFQSGAEKDRRLP